MVERHASFTNLALALALALTASCSSDGKPTQGGGTIEVEKNALGIAHVQVDHVTQAGDRVLEVRGFDAADAQIALLTLRTGKVTFVSESGQSGVYPMGTEINVSVGDKTMEDVSPIVVRYQIPFRLAAPIATFVGLAEVATAVSDEAGITFPSSQTKPTEITYSQGCDDIMFPTNKNGSNHCCQENAYNGVATWHLIDSGTTIGVRFGIRAGGCRNADETTGCTGTGCYYGPCGFKVVSTHSGSNPVIYNDSTDFGCSWDDGDGGYYGPEPYYGTQYVFGGVGTACDCVTCNSDGTTDPGCNKWW